MLDERRALPVATALAVVGIVSALLRYVLPHGAHVAVTEPLFGAYATDQLAVLMAHPVSEHLHRLGGIAYMVLGILQLRPAPRRRVHRYLGRVFVALTCIVGASGAFMALHHPYVAGETAPSVLFAGLLVGTAVRAVVHARRGEIALHREWMIRSFAIGLGIGTIRVIAVALTVFTDIPTTVIVAPSFWVGWTGSLIAAELWIRAGRREGVAAGMGAAR